MQVPFADPLSGFGPRDTILPLVGREMEMHLISALLEIVAQDKPMGARALVLSGEIGVGKSRLLTEMHQQAREQGFTLLETRTYETGSMFPFLPFIEALRPVIRTSSLQQLQRYTGLSESGLEPGGSNISLTGMPLIIALSQLFPELAPRMGLTLPPQEVLSPDQEKFRLFDSIATLLEQMALEQPVLLSTDNLQWADSASLELTMYLTVRLHRSRVALVGATRPPSFTSNDPALESAPNAVATAMKILGKLMRQGLLLFLPLEPLGMEAAREYLQALLPGLYSDDILQTLLQRAEGNPYFLEELVRTLALREYLVLRNGSWQAHKALATITLPESITLAVEERLQGLRCRELLQVATLFGRTFQQEPLTEVSGQTPAEVHTLLDEAIQQALIIRVPSDERSTLDATEDESFALPERAPTLLFCRGVVHETLRAEISPQRATQLHGVIGAALERYYGGEASVHAAELAHHYIWSERKTEALHWSMRAGEEATRQQAHREAIGYLRTVLRLLAANPLPGELPAKIPLMQVSLALGESWLKLGELTQAGNAFRQALEQQAEARVSTDEQGPLLRARANRLLGDVYRLQGKYELALEHLQVASDLLKKDERNGFAQEPVDATRTFTFWLSAGRSYTQLSRGSETGGNTQVLLHTLSATEQLLFLQASITLDILLFRPEKAEDGLWQAYRLATEIGDRGAQAFALHFLGWIRGWGEHIDEATRLISEARELYTASGDPFHAVLGDQSLGIIYQARGEMDQARFYNQHGFDQAQRYGIQHILGWLHCNQGIMALAQGDWEECSTHLQNALLDAEESSNIRLEAFATLTLALLHARQGNWSEADLTFHKALLVAIHTEWYPSTLALYGHFLAVTGREAAALVQLELVEAEPAAFGYSGQFYIPFLAEAHLHLQKPRRAVLYIDQIRNLRGFCYFGVSVDRILGEVAAQQGDWETAERAFEDGLTFCRRSNHRPEEAAILYEQARMVLMRSRDETEAASVVSRERIHSLCTQARMLFLEYRMQRAADLVSTLQEGLEQLEELARPDVPIQAVVPAHLAHAGYQLELRLTRRELDVLRLVAEGQTDREVAEALVLSPRTVNRHLSNIFTKLDVPGRAAAVAYAIRQGLVK